MCLFCSSSSSWRRGGGSACKPWPHLFRRSTVVGSAAASSCCWRRARSLCQHGTVDTRWAFKGIAFKISKLTRCFIYFLFFSYVSQQQKKYQKIKSATTVVQSYTRGWQVCTYCLEYYNIMLQCRNSDSNINLSFFTRLANSWESWSIRRDAKRQWPPLQPSGTVPRYWCKIRQWGVYLGASSACFLNAASILMNVTVWLLFLFNLPLAHHTTATFYSPLLFCFPLSILSPLTSSTCRT